MIFSRLHSFEDFQVLTYIDMQKMDEVEEEGTPITIKTNFINEVNDGERNGNLIAVADLTMVAPSLEDAQQFLQDFDKEEALSFRNKIEDVYRKAQENGDYEQ